MRRRNIDPAFFSSDQVIACSVPARLLFIGLWTLADREGRLRDEPGRIKRQLFPDDKTNVELWLRELADVGLLDRYSVDDEPLICIPGFGEHQTIHPNEARSKLAPPPRDREMSLQGPPKEVNVHRNSGPSELKPSVNSGPSETPKPPSGAVVLVWEGWLASTGRSGCKLDEKRKRLITARLADYPTDDVFDAVRGWERDPWPERKQQNGIEILLRDGAHLEKFRDLWRQPRVAPTTRWNPDVDQRIRDATARDQGWHPPANVIDMGRVVNA